MKTGQVRDTQSLCALLRSEESTYPSKKCRCQPSLTGIAQTLCSELQIPNRQYQCVSGHHHEDEPVCVGIGFPQKEGSELVHRAGESC